MLRNERYRGVLVWGRREKTYRRGTKVRLRTDPREWVVAARPELRIISDELWLAVQGLGRAKGEVPGSHPPRRLTPLGEPCDVSRSRTAPKYSLT